MKYFANTKLTVVGTKINIPLFANAGQRFRVAINENDEFLADVLSIELSSEEASALVSFGSYDGSDFAEFKIGDLVTNEGYAGQGVAKIAATTTASEITGFDGIRFSLSKPSITGLSGSPVFGAKGLIGICYGDVGHPGNLSNAVGIAFKSIENVLFA